jgi:chaperone required for assembly of F1-ATPase
VVDLLVERWAAANPSLGRAISPAEEYGLALDPGRLEQSQRFYKTVDVAAAGGGFAVRLDQRTPRTPRGARLILPTSGLADLVAKEWADQRDQILLADMPATRLAHTALDGAPGAQEKVVESVVRFAASDLLCYLADGPESLSRRQIGVWGPLLEWARDSLGMEFIQTRGIVHRTQPPETLARLSSILQGLDDFTLVGVASGSALFGSAVLALALRHGRLDAAAADAASGIDEAFQEERWGVDAEAAARAAILARDALMLERWFAALGRV